MLKFEDYTVEDAEPKIEKQNVSIEEDVSNTENNLNPPPEEYKCLDQFSDAAEFLAFFDQSINDGLVTLYPWQVEILQDLSHAKPNGLNPYKFALCAANGSGKDAFVIAPFAVFFICCKKRSRVIITSSSGVQLTNQTEKYITSLSLKINLWSIKNLGRPLIKIRKRLITCIDSGSEIMLFATDEGEKAEGYHPSEPNAEMAIIVNEAKSVSTEIFSALQRCTGYNYWIDVSSPGEPMGKFHEHFENWPNKRRVTFFDCLKHQSRSEYEYDKRTLGEHDPLFRSKWLALFTSIGGNYVVNQLALEQLRGSIKNNLVPEVFQDKEVRVGIDIALSSRGDETVISVFKGNKQKYLICFRNSDATILAGNISKELTETVKIPKSHPFIYIDDGNVGRAVADIMRRDGWTGIHRVLNQSPAKNKKQFRNRGAELWYKFSKLIENQCLVLLDDDKLYSQIQSRKYKTTEAGMDKMTLQKKSEAAASGLNSPDRADATVLAFTDTNVEAFLDKFETFNLENIEPQEISLKDKLENLIRELQKGPKVEKKKGRFQSLHKIMKTQEKDRRLLKYES